MEGVWVAFRSLLRTTEPLVPVRSTPVTVSVSPRLGSIALARRLTVTAWPASVLAVCLAAVVGCSTTLLGIASWPVRVSALAFPLAHGDMVGPVHLVETDRTDQ